MADKQYDDSAATKRTVEAYAKRRALLREQYIKQITNPHRHGTGEGGTLVRKISHIYFVNCFLNMYKCCFSYQANRRQFGVPL
jgi:hypothetical protein